jgi:hypothetical protein
VTDVQPIESREPEDVQEPEVIEIRKLDRIETTYLNSQGG